ncbi:MAG: hypothetical protein ACM3U1_09895 [Chloroflexota bacterium]
MTEVELLKRELELVEKERLLMERNRLFNKESEDDRQRQKEKAISLIDRTIDQRDQNLIDNAERAILMGNDLLDKGKLSILKGAALSEKIEPKKGQ